MEGGKVCRGSLEERGLQRGKKTKGAIIKKQKGKKNPYEG